METIRDLLPKRRGRFTKKEDHQVDKIKQIQADVVAQQTVNTKHKVYEAGNAEGGKRGLLCVVLVLSTWCC
jgi:hypothetical protein